MSEQRTFVDAMNAGIARVNEIREQSVEIEQILKDLKLQIFSATSNRVEVIIIDDRLDYKSYSAPSNLFASIFGGKARFINKIIAAKYGNDIRRLAYWETSKGGYPCTIRYGNVNASAEDKESLSRVLENMLSAPDIAQNILDLLENDSVKKESI